ncbi:MAG: hypothetical protein KI790_01545 [Cyclobacteriaceae bacterium]|nr:hypothetical protein [Cyclobacteriaceae bacterium HetDA_MAG_MS6]
MIDRKINLLCLLVLLSCTRSVEYGSEGTAISENAKFSEISELPVQQTLPTLMVNAAGDPISTTEEWKSHREYIKEMLVFYQYGAMPQVPNEIEVVQTAVVKSAKEIRENYSFIISRNGKQLAFRFGLVRPNTPGRFPVVIKNDRYRFDVQETENPAAREKYAKQNRGEIDQLVADEAVERGYIYCKFIREDIAADENGQKVGRIFDLYPEYDWGAITAWAWAYQIIIDWVEKQDWADTEKIVATGHSRGGKTALCAGIFDERIAVTVPNSSGLGGTGSLRFYDFTKGNIQTIDHQVNNFLHWWPDRWYTLKDHIDKVPFDTHFAKALIAPRALLNPHARQDFLANPYGTYLTYLAAQPVFDLLGVSENNAIHWRDGGHAQGEEDWMALFDYCDQYFYQKSTDRRFDQNPYPGAYQFELIDPHDVTKRSTDE